MKDIPGAILDSVNPEVCVCPCVCVNLLLVIWFSLTVQRLAVRLGRDAEIVIVYLVCHCVHDHLFSCYSVWPNACN